MTRTEQLELIRRKCVEANTDSGIMNKTYPGIQKRPLRLADVLLAIGQTRHLILLRLEEDGLHISTGTGRVSFFYDLRQDDITLQSDECVAFLAELLK